MWGSGRNEQFHPAGKAGANQEASEIFPVRQW